MKPPSDPNEALSYFLNVLQDGNVGYREMKQREALRGIKGT